MPFFFAIFQTSKLVDRSIHDYALGVAALFRVKRVYLSRYSQKNKEVVRAIDLFSLYVVYFQLTEVTSYKYNCHCIQGGKTAQTL